MTDLAAEPRSGGDSPYRTLLANFEAAYRNMRSSSEDFNNALAEVSAGLNEHAGRTRIDEAGRAYEEARDEFMYAVAKLNEFLIAQIISSRSTILETSAHG
jgi:hypothetical protein